MEDWITTEAGHVRVHGVSQLFVPQDERGRIVLLISKVTDDLPIAGSIVEMEIFSSLISKRFEVRKTIIGEYISSNGTKLGQNTDGDACMEMEDYLKKIKHTEITQARKNMEREGPTIA